MTLLSDLTFIVPTYNRQNYALRVMHFWSNNDVKVHVLDGSTTPIKFEILKNVGTNITYYHMPITFQERLFEAIKLVDTPFVALLCDDDFYMPSALENCMKFLKEHDDYIVCIGRCLGYYSFNKNILGVPLYAEMKSIKSPIAKKRMIEHMNPYFPSTIYGVHRTEIWKKTIPICCPPNFVCSCPYVTEILFELSTCYQGKAMVLNDLMWIRNTENPCIDTEEWDRKLRFDHWIKNPKYKSEIDFFYENTVSELSKIGNFDKDKALKVLKLAVNALVDFYGPNKKIISEILSNLERQIVRLIPESPKEAIKSILKRFLPSLGKRLFAIYSKNDGESINEVSSHLKNKGINVNIEELYHIKNFIEKSNFI